MPLCNRCHKRDAVIFVTRMDPKTQQGKTEGYCLPCARELKIQPFASMMDQMGITDDALEQIGDDMQSYIQSLGEQGFPTTEDGNGEGDSPVVPSEQTDETDGNAPDDLDPAEESSDAPALDVSKMFGQFGFPFGNAQSGQQSNRNGPRGKKQNNGRKTLETYCHNLTRRAREGKLDRIVGREKELQRVIQILCRRQKNNPCLIGEPGVGKTAIAEALALRIVAGDVPERLANCEIYLVDLTALVAGTQFRGQFEARILGLINEVKAAGNIILVIDEVHNIVGAGDAEGSMNAANILKPALSRGEIQVIGATTLKEYRKYIEKDSALERRFQPVTVNEPSISETVEMLRGIKGYYESFHSIRIPDSVLYATVTLSERYITDRYLPDKAIDLLDEAAAHVSLSSTVLKEYQRTEKEFAKCKTDSEALEASVSTAKEEDKEDLYRRLADLKSHMMNLTAKLDGLKAEKDKIELTTGDLADVIEIWTGIPASDINRTEFEQLENLEERIRRRIVGQDEAVSAVVRAVRRKRAGVSPRRSPISMIFAGPTGVGKTELVRVLAADLFKTPDVLIRLDMSEFMEKHAVSRIIGAPPGYVGYDEAGQLTEKVRRRPYSVILFDEIEKAHPDVMNILLQILDDGHITDASGRLVNFENTMIVMTTNAGADKATAISGFSESESEQGKEHTERALLTFLRPEFINRVDEIITFHHLTETDFVSIAKIMLSDLAENLKQKNIDFTYSDDAVAYIASASYSKKFGARNMRRYIETHVEDALANELISHYKDRISKASLTMRDGNLSVACL